MTTVCLIPARGGSRRIKRKNIKDFWGKPIIAYSIATARESELFDEIIVSTDDAEIAEVAQKYGASVYMRSAEMSEDIVGTQEVARDFLAHASRDISVLCVMYATAPMIRLEDLQLAHDLVACDEVNYAFSVGTDPLHDAGQFYFGHAVCFAEGDPLISPDTAMVPIPEERDCDINKMADWERAEAMFENLRRSK
jgi:pseudaminic acid cytidylyltransferase